MKGYVVTLMKLDRSVKVAERCIRSALQFDVAVEMFPAVPREQSPAELKKEKLFIQQYDQTYSDVGAVIGNFISQYRIWKIIVETNTPAIVLEHDAIFVSEIPPIRGDLVNLGKPSYGKYEVKDKPGIYPMFSKKGGYIPGAHGYYVTPAGAQCLIDYAQKNGAGPCDMYLNTKNFPDMLEIYPWPIEAHDSFSTIQNVKGCKAKHNFGKAFEILT